MTEYEIVTKNEQKLPTRKYKDRITKIEKYNLVNRVIDDIAENKSYAYIAKKLIEYVRNRKINPDPNFSITGMGVKVWWMGNSGKYRDLINEKRNALITQRHCRYLDKGVRLREKIQKDLQSDARNAEMASETAYDYEATSRIREKIIKVQESGEKAISNQSPNLSVTNITINPLTQLAEKMKKKLDEMDEEEQNTIDIEYEDIDETEAEPEVEEEEEAEEEDDIEDSDDEEDTESEEQ